MPLGSYFSFDQFSLFGIAEQNARELISRIQLKAVGCRLS